MPFEQLVAHPDAAQREADLGEEQGEPGDQQQHRKDEADGHRPAEAEPGELCHEQPRHHGADQDGAGGTQEYGEVRQLHPAVEHAQLPHLIIMVGMIGGGELPLEMAGAIDHAREPAGKDVEDAADAREQEHGRHRQLNGVGDVGDLGHGYHLARDGGRGGRSSSDPLNGLASGRRYAERAQYRAQVADGMEFSPVIPAMLTLIEVAIIDGIDGVVSAVAALARPRYRFLRQSWFAAAGGRRPRTLVARRGDRPVIALPIVGAGPGVSMVPGCYWPFRSFPVAEDLDDREMATFLRDPGVRRALGPLWRLGPVYADDPALGALRRTANDAGWTLLERRIATSFLLDIDAVRAEGPWPRGSTLRKNRFHEKHLAEHGSLEWRFVSGAQWTAGTFDDLAAIEAKSWHAGSGDAKFLAGSHRRFWETLARDPVQAAAMGAAILLVGGKPVAFSFDLNVGATRYAIANSYDPAFAKHSPGKCLYYRNLVAGIEDGITTVDWGAGDSGYKRVIGAQPGPEIVDCLFVRGPILGAAARIVGGLWTRSGR